MNETLRRIIPKAIRQPIKDLEARMLFDPKLKQTTPVFIYQMGKVGSTSIYRSLLNGQYNGAVLHGHQFYKNHYDAQVRRLYDWAILQSQPVNIISLTREPIGRNISGFFQNFKKVTGVPYAKSNFSIDDLNELFLSNYWHEHPLTWFDKNILANFGINVFDAPFPQDGIATYSRDHVNLLVMHSEISDDRKVKAIADFLDLKEFRLNNVNIGREKDYSSTYKEFTEEVKLPSDYIEKMCESKYFNHFYDEKVIKAVRKRWSQ